MKTSIAVVSDLHCGSTLGLHPSTPTKLDEGGFYVPSAAQTWMHDSVWLPFWEFVKRESAGGGLHCITTGDLVDGDHHGTAQIVSRHPNVQLDILKTLFAPVVADLHFDSVAVVRGTEVHVGPSGCAEESFGKWLAGQGVRVLRENGTGNCSHWHLIGQYAGKSLDVAHHGRVGTRPWTKVNATMSLAAQIVMEYANSGHLAPDLAIRGHYHQWVDTGDAFRTRVIQMPAFQLATAYVHKVAPGALADLGGALVVIEDGELSVKKFVRKPDRPAMVVA